MKCSTRFARGHGPAALFLAMALSGCGGGGSSVDPTASPAQRVAQLEASGELPKLDRTDSIAGIDANANGVRDDIEQYIEKKYTEPAQRKAAMQTARAYQQMLLVDKSDAMELERVSEASWRAVGCERLAFPGSEGAKQSWKMAQEVKAMTTNTKERLKSLLAYNKARSGSVSSMPEGAACE